MFVFLPRHNIRLWPNSSHPPHMLSFNSIISWHGQLYIYIVVYYLYCHHRKYKMPIKSTKPASNDCRSSPNDCRSSKIQQQRINSDFILSNQMVNIWRLTVSYRFVTNQNTTVGTATMANYWIRQNATFDSTDNLGKRKVCWFYLFGYAYLVSVCVQKFVGGTKMTMKSRISVGKIAARPSSTDYTHFLCRLSFTTEQLYSLRLCVWNVLAANNHIHQYRYRHPTTANRENRKKEQRNFSFYNNRPSILTRYHCVYPPYSMSGILFAVCVGLHGADGDTELLE